MHRIRSTIVLAVSVMAWGCIVPQSSKGTELMHSNMLPTNSPTLNGAYDFELLGPVEGTGCVAAMDSTTYWTSVPGTDIGRNGGELENQAEAAAMFDAISKLKEADSVIPLRLKSEGTSAKFCVTVYGRAFRYLHSVAAPAPAPSAAPVPTAAAAPVGSTPVPLVKP